jgi:hypothetical protein
VSYGWSVHRNEDCEAVDMDARMDGLEAKGECSPTASLGNQPRFMHVRTDM